MFYDITDCDIASYADDNTLYSSSFGLDKVIKKWTYTNNLLKRFHENHMKANAGKCHLLLIRPRVCGDGAFPGDFLAG